ncbi:hypothetical protein RNZ50_00615 [Paracoccaceae bacterium Fryx2]|nr:hypothetical protein [Paracoccaceae bacterium Fryx2]
MKTSFLGPYSNQASLERGRNLSAMANPKNIVEEIRKDLAKARPADRPITTRGIIHALAEDIHSLLKDGARLDGVYEIIRARLPEETRLTLTTFKRYWRESRDVSGLSKIKNSGRRKNCGETTSGSRKVDHMDVQAASKRAPPRETYSDFRADPDNI